MSNTKHHPLSPSKYPAWAECPCYSPEERESSEANEGTLAHEELHKALTTDDYLPDNKAARWAFEWIQQQNPQSLESEFRVSMPNPLDVLDEIYGTIDVSWFDCDGILHVADFKRFSDGTIDYTPQVRGYAAMIYCQHKANLADQKIILHILHGGIFKAETIETTFGECVAKTVEILSAATKGTGKPRICKWCSFCSKVSLCPASNTAVEAVKDNLPNFARLSLCQKLVVLDAIDKLSKSIREKAKNEARLNGGVIEQDGIRYELKPWGGGSKCKDILLVADAMRETKTVEHKTRKGSDNIQVNLLSNGELLDACSLSKTALVNALKNKNPESSVSKADWERFVEQFFEETEGTPHFVRVL